MLSAVVSCCSDLLSTYSANGSAAFGSYTEMPADPHKDDDDDFDGFVGGPFGAIKTDGAEHVTRGRQPATVRPARTRPMTQKRC